MNTYKESNPAQQYGLQASQPTNNDLALSYNDWYRQKNNSSVQAAVSNALIPVQDNLRVPTNTGDLQATYTREVDSVDNLDKYAHLRAISEGKVPAPDLSSSDIKFWAHEVNRPLIGDILGFDEFEHKVYGLQKTIIVKRDNGEVVSAILTDYLQKGIAMQTGKVGDMVLIEKQGQERSQNGKTFNKFMLVVHKPDN